MLTAEEHTFETIAGLWSDLLPRSPRSTVFDSPSWQRVWWSHFGEGATLRLLSLPDGDAAGIAPLTERDGVVSFLGGTDLVDYHDFITAGRPGDGFFDALVAYLGTLESFAALDLTSVPAGSAILEKLPVAAEAAGWRTETEQEDVAPRLALPDSWDEYLSSLSRKNRHELRRKLRRLEGAGDVRAAEATDPRTVEEGMDDFVALVRKSAPEKAAFLTPERERFFRAAALALAEEGLTRLLFLELDGVRVASSLGFVWGGERFLYNSGYDPEHRHLAVGLLSHAVNIRNSIEEGLTGYDFMRGGESYKYHLGAEDRTIHRIVVRR